MATGRGLGVSLFAVCLTVAVLVLPHSAIGQTIGSYRSNDKGGGAEYIFEIPAPSYLHQTKPSGTQKLAPGSGGKSSDKRLVIPNASPPLIDPMSRIDPISDTAGAIDMDADRALNNLDAPDEFNAPPDPHAAAGPEHVVMVVNSSIMWDVKDPDDRDTNTRVAMSLEEFFASIAPPDPADPLVRVRPYNGRVIYDQHRSRFVVVALDRVDDENGSFGESRILVAVSIGSDPNSETANPAGGFLFEDIAMEDFTQTDGRIADFPSIAVDDEFLYITANLFEPGPLGTFVTSYLFAVEKNPFYEDRALDGFDPGSDVFDADSVSLYDPAIRGGTFATTTVPTHIYGREPYGCLYASDNQNNNLITVEPSTGRSFPVGPFEDATGAPITNVTEIEWSPDGCTLFGTTSGAAPSLLRINPDTGAILEEIALALVGEALTALEFLPNGDLIAAVTTTGGGMGTGGTTDRLVLVDRETGGLTDILTFTAVPAIGGLAFNEGFRNLYGITSGGMAPTLINFEIDTTENGFSILSVTFVATTMPVEASSLEFLRHEVVGDDPSAFREDILITAGDDEFVYEIEATTGIATSIPLPPGTNLDLGGGKLSGLSFQPVPGTWLVRYSGVSDSFGNESLSVIRMDNPTAKMYAVTEAVAGDLYLVDVNTGVAELVAELSDDGTALADPVTEMEWSPDGMTLYVAIRDGATFGSLLVVDALTGEIEDTLSLFTGAPDDDADPTTDPGLVDDNQEGTLDGLEFDADRNLLGTLHLPNDLPNPTTRLVQINTMTGEVTGFVRLQDGAGGEVPEIEGMAYCADFETLYAISDVDGNNLSDIIEIPFVDFDFIDPLDPTATISVLAGDLVPSVGRSLEFTRDQRLVTAGTNDVLYALFPEEAVPTAVVINVLGVAPDLVTGLSVRPPSFTHEFVHSGDIDDLSQIVPDAPQLASADDPGAETPALLSTNDRRALNAVWRNDYLYTVATIVPPANGYMYAIAACPAEPPGPSVLVRIDPDTGDVWPIGEIRGADGTIATNLRELIWSTDGSTLYATTDEDGSGLNGPAGPLDPSILRINPATGEVIDSVEHTDFSQIEAMTFSGIDLDNDPDTEDLAAALFFDGPGTTTIVRIDPATGASTNLVVGFNGRIAGMVYDSDTDQFFAITGDGQGDLLRFDPTTGSIPAPTALFTDILPLFFEAESMTITADGRLVVGARSTDTDEVQLFEIDPAATMAADVATVIDNVPLCVIYGLAPEPGTDIGQATVHWWQVDTTHKLYASAPGPTDGAGGTLLVIDPKTGRADTVGAFEGASGDVIEIEWVPGGHKLLASTGGDDMGDSTRSIHMINPETAQVLATALHAPFPVADTDPLGDLPGLAFDFFGRLIGSLYIPDLVASDDRPSELVVVDFQQGGLFPVSTPFDQIDISAPPVSPIDTFPVPDPPATPPNDPFPIDPSDPSLDPDGGFGEIGGLAFPPGFAKLYGITQRGLIPPPDANRDDPTTPALLLIDPLTGAVDIETDATGAILDTDVFITQFDPAISAVDLGEIQFRSLEFTRDGRLVTASNSTTNEPGTLYVLDLNTADAGTRTVDVNAIGPIELDDNPATIVAEITGLAQAPLRLFDQGNVGAEDLMDDITNDAIDDDDSSSGNYTFFPSIAVDVQDNVGIGFSASGPEIFAGAFYTFRAATDPKGGVHNTGVLTRGVAPYQRDVFTFNEPKNRWGDYSAVAIDPDLESAFWVFNAFAQIQEVPAPDEGGDGEWGTSLGSFDFITGPEPPPPGTDLDLDGLSLEQELLLGTDPNNPDTDGDGLLDGAEVSLVFGLLTNPLSADTDGDGIEDGDEVSATNGFGTSPTDFDSDGDGVGDGQEVANGTDPLDPGSFPPLPGLRVPFFR